MNKTELHTRINEAVSAFWETKQKQLSSSGDSSNRGAVTAGKQLDGFITLLKDIAIQQGVPEECFYVSQAYLPGYFRSSKDWDFLIITPKKKLAVAIELKSQVGSYGNNFNNRTEEAVGSAVDLWTAFRKNNSPTSRLLGLGILP